MTRLADIVAALSPAQRERLLRLPQKPAVVTALSVGAKPAASSGERWRTVVESSSRRDGDRVTLVFKGLVLVSEANEREHWRTRKDRHDWQQSLVASALARVSTPAGPWSVTIARQGPRRMDDDNAQGSGKHVRDAIATWLGCDDGDRTRFRCAVVQELGDYVVRVTIEGSAW